MEIAEHNDSPDSLLDMPSNNDIILIFGPLMVWLEGVNQQYYRLSPIVQKGSDKEGENSLELSATVRRTIWIYH